MVEPYYDCDGITIYHGDAATVLAGLPAGSVDCCVTSPPYWGLRDYGEAGQLGLEPSPDEYAAALVGAIEGVRRVLTDAGTLWLNLGDSYITDGGVTKAADGGLLKDRMAASAGGMNGRSRRGHGLKQKDLAGIPWRVAFALQAAGWYLRQDIIWHKPNPMPESVRDRCTKAHEYVFLLSKSRRYHFDAAAIAEPAGKPKRCGPKNAATRKDVGRTVRGDGVTRNRRSVWKITPASYKKAHFATFPPALVEPCILAGCPAGGVVLDPFIGSATTAVVARDNGRRCVGIDLNREYCDLAVERLAQKMLI